MITKGRDNRLGMGPQQVEVGGVQAHDEGVARDDIPGLGNPPLRQGHDGLVTEDGELGLDIGQHPLHFTNRLPRLHPTHR